MANEILLRPEVDSARWFVKQQNLWPPVEPFPEHELLLIASRQVEGVGVQPLRIKTRLPSKRPATRENRGPKPNFRARLGEFLGSECQNARTGPPAAYCVRVTPRVNIASDAAPKLILRDSASR